MLKKIKYRFMSTSKLMDLRNALLKEVQHLSSWPLRTYKNSSLLVSIINEDLQQLQDYIIPELKRRKLN